MCLYFDNVRSIVFNVLLLSKSRLLNLSYVVLEKDPANLLFLTKYLKQN
jgi:hypothetical protein